MSKYIDKSSDVIAQDELYERLDRIRAQSSSKLANQQHVCFVPTPQFFSLLTQT